MNHAIHGKRLQAAGALTLLAATLLPAPAHAATISWDGGGNNSNWHNPLNWTGDLVPGTGDDVVISGVGAKTILVTTSQEFNKLDLESGISVTVDGNGVSFQALGAVKADGANFRAQNGSTISLPGLATYRRLTTAIDCHLEADGEGSRLSLPNLTAVASVPSAWQELYFSAIDGGVVELPAVSQASGSVVFTSRGRDSLGRPSELALPSLPEFEGAQGLPQDIPLGFRVFDGGILRLVNLRALKDASLSLSDTGLLEAPRLADINDANVAVAKGATLTLPLVSQYFRRQSATDRDLRADGEGSRLSLPNLTAVASVPDYWTELYISAIDGGVVELPAVSQASGSVVFTSRGRDSLGRPSELALPSLPEFEGAQGLPQDIPLGFRVFDGGILRLVNLRALKDASLSLSDTGLLEAPRLADINDANVAVAKGATLTLPLVSQYFRRQSATDRDLRADGEGSRLSLPNLTAVASVPDYWTELYISAIDGGVVELPAVSQASGSVVFTSRGRDGLGRPSELALPSLPEFEGAQGLPLDTTPGFQATSRGLLVLGKSGQPFKAAKGAIRLEGDGRVKVNTLELASSFKLFGGGTIDGNLATAGEIEVPNVETPLVVTGNLTLLSTAKVKVYLYRQLILPVLQVQMSVGGEARLAGHLDLPMQSGLVPKPSDHFRVFTWGSRTGEFATFGNLKATDTLEFSMLYNPNNLEVTPTPNAPPQITLVHPAVVAYDSFGMIGLGFSESINPATFTPEDVRLVGPAGNIIPVTSVEGTVGSVFTVRFPSQTVEGDYHFEIGPNIEDYAGNRMAAPELHSVALRSTANESYTQWRERLFDSASNTDPAIVGEDADPDGDDLSNLREFVAKTHPTQADTDGDGFGDGVEVAAGTSPLDAASHPILPQPARVATQPASLSVPLGRPASFTVTATGSEPIYYQWFKGGQSIPNATGGTLALPAVQAADVGAYSVLVSNADGGEISGRAQLTLGGLECPPAELEALRVPGLLVEGSVGCLYRIEFTASLSTPNWQPLETISLLVSPHLWVDVSGIGQPNRFYRAVVPE